MAEDTKSGKPDSSDSSTTGDADKGKGLGALLNEYEENTKPVVTKQTGDSSADEIKALKQQVEDLSTREASRLYRTEMDDHLVPAIKGDLDVHPKLVENWINEQADSDPRLMKLWNERGSRSREFNEAIVALKPEFEAYAEKEGIKGTAKPKEDAQRGLKSAIRGARTTQSDTTGLNDTDLNAMSDTAFAMHKSEIFRLAAAGQLQ